MYFTTVILSLLVVAEAAGPHQNGRFERRRHHARAALSDKQRQALPLPVNLQADAPAAKRDECMNGDWQCIGAELQRCNWSEWVSIANCTGESLACSTQKNAVGCVWTWFLSSEAGAQSTVPHLAPSTGYLQFNATSVLSASAAAATSNNDYTNANATFAAGPTITSNASITVTTSTNDDNCENNECGTKLSGKASFTLSKANLAASTTALTSPILTSFGASPTSNGTSVSDDECDEEPYESTHFSQPASNSASVILSAVAKESSALQMGAGLYASDGDNYNSNIDAWQSTSESGKSKSWETWETSWASDTAATEANAWEDSSKTASITSTGPWDDSATATATSNDYWASSTTKSAFQKGHHKGSKTPLHSNDWASATATHSASTSKSIGFFNSTGSASGKSSSPSGDWTAPHYVVYSNRYLEKMPSVSDLGSYNRFVLAFWQVDGGAVDNVQTWASWEESYRQQVIEEYHNAGIALMISAFGSTDKPTTDGADPKETAQKLADFVKQYGLDGVDIDYEDMSAMNSAQAVSWIVQLQQELRNLLPSPYIISHAPVAPWFTSANDYSDGAYSAIHKQVGDTIDFYSVQFYNQGDNQYISCQTLIENSGSEWPSTSVFELNSSANVPLDKIVIGKPLDAGAANDGYMSPSDLNECVNQAKQKGWNGGVMFWEWTHEAPAVILAVRG
ncbi:hypothetical protein L204_101432 [Cryptococcus depauperatus]|nr:hypothetical protein L204_04103 [Cryptococcus depauperatus CBS 7855]